MPPAAPVTMTTRSWKRISIAAGAASAPAVLRRRGRRRRFGRRLDRLVCALPQRPLALARRVDRHPQADTLGRQHVAPFARDLLAGRSYRADAEIEVVQAERVDCNDALA